MAGAQRALTCGSLVPDSRNPKSVFFVELACSIEFKAPLKMSFGHFFICLHHPVIFFRLSKFNSNFDSQKLLAFLTNSQVEGRMWAGLQCVLKGLRTMAHQGSQFYPTCCSSPSFCSLWKPLELHPLEQNEYGTGKPGIPIMLSVFTKGGDR